MDNNMLQSVLSESVAKKLCAIYEKEMRKMNKVPDFALDSSVHGKISKVQIMYKMPCVMHPEGDRGYEFLVEFDKSDSSTGIYYGVKGLIFNEDKYQECVNKLRHDWECVRGEVCQILNNVFPGKDFSSRFIDTNNAWEYTYWPFWIRLNEDEDIVETAAMALRLMRKVYERYVAGEKFVPVDIKKKKATTITYFTDNSFNNLLSSLKEEYQRNYFMLFIKNAEMKGHLLRDDRYEKAWRVMKLKDVDFAFLLYGLWSKLNESDDPRVPWQKFRCVFLDKDGKAYNDHLKKQLSSPTASAKSKETKDSDINQRKKTAKKLISCIME